MIQAVDLALSELLNPSEEEPAKLKVAKSTSSNCCDPRHDPMKGYS